MGTSQRPNKWQAVLLQPGHERHEMGKAHATGQRQRLTSCPLSPRFRQRPTDLQGQASEYKHREHEDRRHRIRTGKPGEREASSERLSDKVFPRIPAQTRHEMYATSAKMKMHGKELARASGEAVGGVAFGSLRC